MPGRSSLRFPIVYATVFSGLYLALMLVMLALIMRAVSLEFRGQVAGPGWRRFWDWAFGLGSLLPALLFGVAIGNILKGLPIEEDGAANVAFLSLLNPYALLIGVMSLVMFVMHGAAYMTVKTEGTLQQRLARWVGGGWIVFALLAGAALVTSYFVSPFLYEGVWANPLFWVFLVLLVLAALYIPLANRAGKHVRAFLASSVSIAALMGLAAVGLFPRMVPFEYQPGVQPYHL